MNCRDMLLQNYILLSYVGQILDPVGEFAYPLQYEKLISNEYHLAFGMTMKIKYSGIFRL